jgi:ABC-type tungstate transport system permease subunit
LPALIDLFEEDIGIGIMVEELRKTNTGIGIAIKVKITSRCSYIYIYRKQTEKQFINQKKGVGEKRLFIEEAKEGR